LEPVEGKIQRETKQLFYVLYLKLVLDSWCQLFNFSTCKFPGSFRESTFHNPDENEKHFHFGLSENGAPQVTMVVSRLKSSNFLEDFGVPPTLGNLKKISTLLG